MKLSFRWYGENDPVTLEKISQIPTMRSVVSAVYDVKPGGVWSVESIEKINYMHIKDALADGNVVPAGEGVGNVEYITCEFVKGGGDSFTVEPHLAVFDALKGLEHKGDEIKIGKAFVFENKSQAFDAACAAFKKITERISE